MYMQRKIIHKNVEMLCSVFVVAGNGPVLIGIPDCKRSQLLVLIATQ